MWYETIIPLPERTIGRAGRDPFLSHKDVTIVMVPYERHSVFPKAVDELYRNVQVPFNLIVVEGNAPEDIRIQLENRQRQHGNMTIIYTNHYPALANAFNLAMPHFKTPYALFIDNEIRLTKGMLEDLLAAAQEKKADVLCPSHTLVQRQVQLTKGDGKSAIHSVETFGLRPCFLISQEAVRGMGKLFEELSSPYTFGVDLIYKMRSKGMKIVNHSGAKPETMADASLRAMDLPIYRAQWSRERYFLSLESLEKKWGINLMNDPVYGNWLQSKMEQAEKPMRMDLAVLSRMFSNIRILSHAPTSR